MTEDKQDKYKESHTRMSQDTYGSKVYAFSSATIHP